ncbi:hypothetical protein BC826DRAFT_1007381 [Russula brevipes]|nr:hypothetical protein BC826DRAFT_1007381 [Russula brevipes]
MPSFVPERPTLPPLRSLALPMHGVPAKMTLPGLQGLSNHTPDPSHGHSSQTRQRRWQEPVSSPTSLYAPSPPPSIAGPLASTFYNSAASHPHHVHQPNPAEPHVRLVLTDSLENADAVLVICSTTGASNASGAPRMISSPDALNSIKPGAPVLVVGPALERIRRPGTGTSKGVRMHPYRIAQPTGTTSNSPATPSAYYAPRK